MEVCASIRHLSLLTLIGWYCVTPGISAESVYQSKVYPYDAFASQVARLVQEFPNQNPQTWKTILAATIHIWREAQSDYPVVLLVASPFQHASVSRRLGEKIAAAFEVAKGMTPEESVADMDKLKHLSKAKQKLELDYLLHTTFTIDNRKAVVIDNLQAIDPNAALLLRRYCDNDDAPHKDVMIVLMLYYNEKNFQNADSHLEKLWRAGLGGDTLEALLSRVANNVVKVEAEGINTPPSPSQKEPIA